MSNIRDLFDSTRALNRQIEKVITYQNRGDEQLRKEISEYVVTDNIEENFSDLLKKMQLAMQGGGGNEIGAWVSGFYGSGKSSFTKYFGFALDRSMKIGDDPFSQLLQNQLKTASVRALFNQVSGTYDAAVIFLDLASEMLAGASMEDISTVLYLKVLQWAGYSEDLKVAELERMLEGDGLLDKFLARAREELDGTEWKEARNQPLIANQIAARLAAELYPKYFSKPEDFQNVELHVNKTEIKRAEEMIELIRRKSGKNNILFIIDEVGQYVSAKPNLILNLDGLAKNLKQIGGGSVWLFATAQQTLTEDNASAMLNAPGLFKLKDRFPIQVHLEASDIKEICHKRLLSKSAKGEKDLAALFDAHGASLRTSTQLANGGVYDTELSKKVFIDLYPFLPAHFEILLQLLGRLARKTGGLGLRSAIKVLQEVLVEKRGASDCLADAPSGTLANTVTFYDSLRRDIQSSYAYIVEGVQRVTERFPGEKLYHQVAKSIAVLQILENLPVTAQNIAALLQPNVSAASLKDEVEKAIDAMLKDGMIPLGEKNGSLRFLTQAGITLQKQFDQIEFRQADLRSELNGVLRSIFKPLPSARLSGVRPVTAGLKIGIGGGQSVALEGDKEAIQFHVEFAPAESYDQLRTERENESRAAREKANIFLLGRTDPDADKIGATLVRCRLFLNQHRTASDPETQEFVRIIDERMQRSQVELERKLHTALYAGSFVAQGAHKAVQECGADVQDSAKNFLADMAAKVFDHYADAACQAESGLAEKFLKTPLDRVTTKEDPLTLVSHPGGRAQIKSDHKAIVAIKDFLGQQGQVEGRRILDHFSIPPYGWSKDTTRYILAGAFLGGEVKLRISGQDHVVKSDEALTAFSSNKAFAAVGISLREERPDPEALMRASDRLCKLSGDTILPLEDEVAAAAKKIFPCYQSTFGPLAVELKSLGLNSAGQSDRASDLAKDLAEIVSGDGSDAVKRLGGKSSPLYDDLMWARQLKKALENGLQKTLEHIKDLREEIASLPSSGVPAELKDLAAKPFSAVDDIFGRESFFNEAAQLKTLSGELDRLVTQTVTNLAEQQVALANSELEKWQNLPDWMDLTDEQRAWFSSQASGLIVEAEGTLDGLRNLLNHEYSVNHNLRDLAQSIAQKAAENRAERDKIPDTDPEGEPAPEPVVADEELLVPKVFKSSKDVDLLIQELSTLRARISGLKHIRIRWKEID